MFKRLIIWTFVVFLGGASLGVSALFYLASDLPSVEIIQDRQISESTKIFDRTGENLLFEIHGEEKRTVVGSDEISNFMKEAIVSVEDASFYTNPAFDWRGILRAVFINITRGSILQGGSTITQQLAKKTFLTDERTPIRKAKELILAFRLEKRYSKEEILTLYLNQIPFGANAYGVESAANIFFNKKAKDLNLTEAAVIASLPKAPSYYSPWGSHKEELLKRKDFVLSRMHELGYIDEIQLNAALNTKIDFANQPKNRISAPHFVMYVQDYLNKKYGEDFVREGGLVVKTTLNLEMQTIAEESVENGVKRNAELYGGTNGALVAEDPKTGQILAMVGSADFFDIENEGNFNVAAQGLRQPGSTFKPFAYLTAFQKGVTPETIVWDVKTEFDTSGRPERSYSPENYDGVFRGPVKLKDALAQSLNIPAVKTLYLGGIKNTLDNAEKFGITTLSDRSRFGLSLVLGGGEVKPIELVNAYSVFANEGIKKNISVILEIKDSKGRVLEEFKNSEQRVVDAEYPRLINDILSDIDLRRGLFQNSVRLTQVPGYQIALKTGTTNDYVDAWAVGYTPNLVVGVWAGNNHREPLKSKGGSVLAAIPMWHDFFSKAILKLEPETFNKPKPIEATNPILRGELPSGELHSFLYYMGKTNDSQFQNWEDGVKKWLETNIPDISKFVAENSSIKPLDSISISGIHPLNGDRISTSFNFSANITSQAGISRIEIHFNNELIKEISGDLGLNYQYAETFRPTKINSQNLFTIKVFDKNNSKSEESLILFN